MATKFKDKKILFIYLGIFLSILGSTLYFFLGYNILIPILWLSSIILIGIYFYFKSKPKLSFKSIKTDMIIALILLILFIPVYFYNIYNLPFQMSTDEIIIMTVSERLASQPQPDIFIPSDYFGLPSLVFIFFGTLGKLLGGVNLLNMRMVHAFFGLLSVPSSYILFRTIARRKISIGCAVILGINHSLVVMSRMAMRENLALLGGILILTFLIYGLKKKSLFTIFVSGCFAGLNWYGYYAGRSTIIIIFLLLGCLGIFYKDKYKIKTLIKYAFVVFLGFILVFLPLLTAIAKQANDTTVKEDIKYQRQTTLLFPQGRELQRQNSGVDTTSEAVKINIINGLTTYNNFILDHGMIYINKGNGFLDPLTGVFLWIGFLVIFFKRKEDEKSFLILIVFLFYLFLFSFIVNQSPKYSRLLISLPFVCYLSAVGLNKSSEFFERIKEKLKPNFRFKITNIIFIFFLLIIVSWNLSIINNFNTETINQGDILGGTARYIEARKNIEEYTFYLAADNKNYYYYYWGDSNTWKHGWMGFFKGDSQNVVILSPEEMVRVLGSPPFTIFMSGKLWEREKDTIAKKYSNFTIHKIKTDGSRLAIEVK